MQDIGPVLNPESARSSITIHSWTLFKKARQSQVLPSRYQRQPRRPTPFVPRCKKPLNHRTDTDSGRSLPHTSKQASREGAVPFFSLSTYLLMNYVTIETMLFAGLSNVRAPLDVVLGGGYMGPGPDTIAHLLLPVCELISLSPLIPSLLLTRLWHHHSYGNFFQDELSTSSDLYTSEDTILNMDPSFAPSTINLRDLE